MKKPNLSAPGYIRIKFLLLDLNVDLNGVIKMLLHILKYYKIL